MVVFVGIEDWEDVVLVIGGGVVFVVCDLVGGGVWVVLFIVCGVFLLCCGW